MASQNVIEGRKNRIMEAALAVFSEKGFQETTMADIGKAAGVSEPTIYEYFGTKEALMFAIPEKISKDGNEVRDRILPAVKGTEARLRAIMYVYYLGYYTKPDYTALVLLQLMSSKRFRQTTAHSFIRQSSHCLLDCIRAGIDDGTFKKDADAFVIRSILLGATEHLFMHWLMQGMPAEKSNMMDYLDRVLDTVLDGIRSGSEDSDVVFRMRVEDAQRFFKAEKTPREKVKAKSSSNGQGRALSGKRKTRS
jgi:TetR/AcrR family transcriptional regulator, fatty acid metabolism regulator protein